MTSDISFHSFPKIAAVQIKNIYLRKAYKYANSVYYFTNTNFVYYKSLQYILYTIP